MQAQSPRVVALRNRRLWWNELEACRFKYRARLIFVNTTEGQTVFAKSAGDHIRRGAGHGYFPGSGGSMLGPINPSGTGAGRCDGRQTYAAAGGD